MGKFRLQRVSHEWLLILLDAYHEFDIGVYEELHREAARRRESLACHVGCYNCCLRADVPISELELSGLYWFCSVKLSGPSRRQVKDQLRRHKKLLRCPFLMEPLCAVYPVRPLACRQYFVFGRPCALDEDLLAKRPQDIWKPSREVAKSAALKMLPFYGLKGEARCLKAFEAGFMSQHSISMHKADLSLIYEAMEFFDSRN
jgi:Fe-S-cluster containining protein